MTDQIVVTGNITSVPERLQVSGGDTMAKFGLASTERRNDNGQWVDAHTSYYSVAVFGRLAEHALSSLERGQRVIVVGRLRIKKWEVGDRSGSTADITATSLGPDLKFGVATFEKRLGGAAHDTPSPSTPSPDDWATTGEHEAAFAPAGLAVASPAPVEAAAGEQPERQLVGAPAWGVSGASALGEDATPF